MDQEATARKFNPNRKLNTLDEVALRIHCAMMQQAWNANPIEAYGKAEKFLIEAERRNPSEWGGE